MIQVLPSWRWGSSDARRPIHLRNFRLRWWAHQQCWKLSKRNCWFKCASGIEFEFTCIQHPTAVPGRCCQRSSCSWPGRNRKDEPTCTKRPACTRAESCASPRRLIESTNSVDFNWTNLWHLTVYRIHRDRVDYRDCQRRRKRDPNGPCPIRSRLIRPTVRNRWCPNRSSGSNGIPSPNLPNNFIQFEGFFTLKEGVRILNPQNNPGSGIFGIF